MKKYLFVLAITSATFLTTACGNAQDSPQSQSKSTIENVNADEFEKGVNNSDVTLLDVRTAQEVSGGHIEGAINYDFYGAGFDEQLKTLDKEKAVYVYCRSGGRSSKTADKLKDLGFTQVYNLEGGIGAWVNSGKKVVK